MFGAIRNGRRSDRPLPPCPCGNTCLCHKPSPSIFSAFELILIGVGLILVVIFLGTIISKSSSAVRTIDVRGETCEIHWKQTGITSTGAALGHDEVICPSWSK